MNELCHYCLVFCYQWCLRLIIFSDVSVSLSSALVKCLTMRCETKQCECFCHRESSRNNKSTAGMGKDAAGHQTSPGKGTYGHVAVERRPETLEREACVWCVCTVCVQSTGSWLSSALSEGKGHDSFTLGRRTEKSSGPDQSLWHQQKQRFTTKAHMIIHVISVSDQEWRRLCPFMIFQHIPELQVLASRSWRWIMILPLKGRPVTITKQMYEVKAQMWDMKWHMIFDFRQK